MTQREKIHLMLNEIKKVNVEFGLLQDIDKLYKQASNEEASAYNSLKEVITKASIGLKSISEIESLINKGIAQAKDLGVPTSDFDNKKSALTRLSTSLSKMSKFKV